MSYIIFWESPIITYVFRKPPLLFAYYLAKLYLENVTRLCLLFPCQRKGKRTMKVIFYFINLIILK